MRRVSIYELAAYRWALMLGGVAMVFYSFKRFLLAVTLLALVMAAVRLWRRGSIYRKAYQQLPETT